MPTYPHQVGCREICDHTADACIRVGLRPGDRESGAGHRRTGFDYTVPCAPIVCNPLGYRKEATRVSNVRENPIFFPHKIIDVPPGAETSNWRTIVAADYHRYDSCYENSFSPLSGHAAAKEQPDD